MEEKLLKHLTPSTKPLGTLARLSPEEYKVRLTNAQKQVSEIMARLRQDYWDEVAAVAQYGRDTILWRTRRDKELNALLWRLAALCAEIHNLDYRIDNTITYLDFDFN